MKCKMKQVSCHLQNKTGENTQVFYLYQLSIAQSKPPIVNCTIFVYNKLTNLKGY